MCVPAAGITDVHAPATHQEYILGAQFTAADVLLTHVLLWAKQIDWLPGSAPLARYLARTTARPAWVATFKPPAAPQQQAGSTSHL